MTKHKCVDRSLDTPCPTRAYWYDRTERKWYCVWHVNTSHKVISQSKKEKKERKV